ncbi:peroxiredoxin-like family protein [Marinifilum flexuosum]|uniref:peroxiredoxin-like family protein n=1 Tax=Marinifilum flexuosum TaxID=1117708 RepID=UPI002492669E|nr:peroxiredoxin-like family protein [Marinifilum flexuosum]
MENKEKRLDQELKKIMNDFSQSAPDEVKEIIGKGISTLAESDLLANAIKEGHKAPDFVLTNHQGEKVSLSNMLQNGPVVLTWYRGGWCPFCNMQLQYLQRSLPAFQELGASLLALTPEKPDGSLSVKEKNELEFEVLSDFNNGVAKSYGIVFKLNDEVSDLYKNTFGLDLEAYNDTDSDELPVPATYVIDKTGLVKYAYLNADYTQRAEPHEMIEVLKKIK